MKPIFLALVLCCLGIGLGSKALAADLTRASARESKEAMAQRAAQETIARLNEQIKMMKAGPASSAPSLVVAAPGARAGEFATTLRRCDEPDQEPTQCVPHCISRYSNETCASYGSDFCGPNAQCAENCISRYSNGTCASYGSDNCGPFASCSENCISRYSNGTCASYGSDICN